MFEFKILEEFKPNPQIIELIKHYTYKIKKGGIKVLLHNKLQIIEPTEYLITHPITLTILKNQNTNGINKYGCLRLQYLKEDKKAIYTTLLMTNELTNHLISVSKNSEERLQMLMENYKNSDKRLSKKIKKLII